MSQNPVPRKERQDFRVLIVYPNLAMMLVPSLAIGLFTRIFGRQGYITDLFDTTHYIADENSSPQNRVLYLQARKFSETDDLGVRIRTDLLGDFRRKVLEFKPDFMIFSVVEDAFMQTLALLEAVKDLEIPHLVGGVFPTAAPDVVLKTDGIRMIGIAEGEETIVEVAEAVREGLPLHNILGTWYKDASGKIYQNPRRTLVDINKYTPDFSLFDESRFLRPMGGRVFKTIPVETYRGCPFACTYCNSPMQKDSARDEGQGNYLRRKAMRDLRDELRGLCDLYNPQFFYFIDDSFLARPRQAIYDFCDMYEEFGLPFWMNTRPETCTPEILKRIREVGAYRFSLGVESGNEQFRQRVLRRNGSNDLLRREFDVIADSGIPFSVNLIIGFPGETRELVMDTVRFMRTLRGYDTLTVSIFTPYHGTVLRSVAVKNGWLAPDYITKHTTASSALTMPPPYLSSQEIDGFMRVVPLLCYFPESEWPAIHRGEIDDEDGNRLLAHYSAIYQRDFLKETQDDDKTFVDGATGCRSNPKDSFRLTYNAPSRLTPTELALLTHTA